MSKILIIKFGALGDVVMATALVDAIVGHHAGASCHLLTTPAFAPLFGTWPLLQVKAIERRGWRNMTAMWRFIRSQSFDRIYDLQGNDRSALLCALSGVRERVGNHTRFPYNHHPAAPWSGQSHIFERMRAVLASAGIESVADAPVLRADGESRMRVARWLQAAGLETRPFALLHAGASALRPDKRWPYYDALAQRLIRQGIGVVWLGGEADRGLNQRLAGGGGIDATSAFSIVELAEIGRYARFAVTNDSGPMHVLSASAIPVFGLFGPSDWRRNHALGQAQNVIACVEIDPAFNARATGDCLHGVTVDLVWSRLVAARVV